MQVFAVVLWSQALIIPPAHTFVWIAGQRYDVRISDQLEGPVSKGGILNLELIDGYSRCSVAGTPGAIGVNSTVMPVTQAKVLIHEVIHIAQSCDKRNLPLDEKIAEDVSDLFNSPLGPFVIKELTP